MFYTTEKQKRLLSRIVEDYDNHEKLGDKFILRMILDITDNAALEWDVNNSTLILYNNDPNKALDFIGCIGLIDYLLKENLVYIHSQEDTTPHKLVLANNAIPKGKAHELSRGISEETDYFYMKEECEYPATNRIELKTDICRKVESFSNSLVYPMPYLVDYVKKDYKTEEQLMFEEQMTDAQVKHSQAMKIAKRTLHITQFAFLAALIPVVFEMYDRRYGNDLTVKELSKTLMENNVPDVINAKLSNDTIKAIIINQPQKTSNKQTIQPALEKVNAVSEEKE